MPPAVLAPPHTQVEPVTETLHGVEVTDPYRWLEDQNSARTRNWLNAQADYTRAYLDAIPGRERIRQRVEELLDVQTLSDPWKVGSRLFFLQRTGGQDQPLIMMSESNSKEEPVILIDPLVRNEEGQISASIEEISRDGRILAYSIRRGGEDACAIEFVELANRQILRDTLPRGLHRGLVLSVANNGFFYAHYPVEDPSPTRRSVRWHTFNTAGDQDREVFLVGDEKNTHFRIIGSMDGQLLAYIVVRPERRLSIDCYIHDIAKGTPAALVAKNTGGLFRPFLVNHTMIALTDWNSPNGRVVALAPDSASHEKWHELVPETSVRIQDLTVVGGVLFVSYADEQGTTIKAFDLEGRGKGVLPCPPRGTAHFVTRRPDSDVLFYNFTSFTVPSALFQYDTKTGAHDLWATTNIPFDSSSIDIEQISYRSHDGTVVPMSLVSTKGSGQPQPTFLTGYGGFGVSVTPQFSILASILIERGCLFAVANVRGGSELGGRWHDAGKRHNRQNAISDFISAAEWLMAAGRSQNGRIAIGGGSNAGTLVAAAITQRPDLFCAVISLYPMLDMLRYHLFDDANLNVDEYGTAETEEDFSSLYQYSPYHRVNDGVAYPAVMLTSGDADMRCNPMHARKMAARLQRATASGRPVLLDYKPLRGHIPVQPMKERVQALTDRISFICSALNVAL